MTDGDEKVYAYLLRMATKHLAVPLVRAQTKAIMEDPMELIDTLVDAGVGAFKDIWRSGEKAFRAFVIDSEPESEPSPHVHDEYVGGFVGTEKLRIYCRSCSHTRVAPNRWHEMGF